jgi:metal-dependent amidase/aminoacylase/carboxypeptidase family protein
VRIHGIFSHGGDAPNIVPEFAELYYYVRSLTVAGLKEAYQKALACAQGAALATGARLEVEPMATYRERVESPQLAPRA